MNKTVTANIGGMVFHIEVDAYEKLNKYLNTIRSYFQNSEEREEIMADIESRIAELFNPKIKSNQQVIGMTEVDEVIEIMGKPEQYIQDDEEPQATDESKTTEGRKVKKRLFRDPDDRVLGGVSSGLGHYLGLDPAWIRILFVLMFLFGMSGFFIYLILWIVMPEAKTAAEKLQMKGEPVTFESIGKAFEEGASKVNQKFKDLDTESFGAKVESFFESVFHVLAVFITGIFKFFGKILGILLLVAGILLIFSLFTGMFNSDTVIYAFSNDGIFSLQSRELFLSLFESETQYNIAKYALFIVIGIPVLGLIYAGIKLLSGFKGHSGIGTAMGIVWLVGVGASLVIGLQLATNFTSESKVTDYEALNSQFDEYVLELNTDDVPGAEVINSSDNDFLLHIDKGNIYYGLPTLDIKRNFKDSLELRIVKKSRGSSKTESTTNARSIVYKINQEGELLSFDSYISFDRQQKIRGQEVQLTLLLPVGKVVYLDESLRELINDIDNVTDTWDSEMLGKKWIMLEEGLTCLDCPDIEGVSSDEIKESSMY